MKQKMTGSRNRILTAKWSKSVSVSDTLFETYGRYGQRRHDGRRKPDSERIRRASMNNRSRRDEAKDYIRFHAADYLRPDGSGKGFICPMCGSGSGKHGTGITTKDGVHFTCWAGCYTNADVIDIIGLQYGIDRYTDKLQKAADIFGISLEADTKMPQIHPEREIQRSEPPLKAQEPEERTDYLSFFYNAMKDIGKTSYHRGLSMETLKRFGIGYVAEWRHPKAPSAPPSPRMIIPTSRYSYLARDTRSNLTEMQRAYAKSKVGKVHIFNGKALWRSAQPVFVVEGEIDAMSICDVGGEAIGLGSVSNQRLLIQALMVKRPTAPLILALDDDRAGQKAEDELSKSLQSIGIRFTKADISAPCKDANEALMKNRTAFQENVREAIRQAEQTEEHEVNNPSLSSLEL